MLRSRLSSIPAPIHLPGLHPTVADSVNLVDVLHGAQQVLTRLDLRQVLSTPLRASLLCLHLLTACHHRNTNRVRCTSLLHRWRTLRRAHLTHRHLRHSSLSPLHIPRPTVLDPNSHPQVPHGVPFHRMRTLPRHLFTILQRTLEPPPRPTPHLHPNTRHPPHNIHHPRPNTVQVHRNSLRPVLPTVLPLLNLAVP